MSALTTDASGTLRITHAVVQFWRVGQWRANLVLAQEAEDGSLPSGAATIEMPGGLALAGRVQRAGLDLPQRPRVVVVGGLGWSAQVAPLFTLSLGSGTGSVRLQAVIRSLSDAAGEPVVMPTDQDIGTHYAAIAGRLGSVRRYREALTDLYRREVVPGWYVDTAGVTRFTARSAAEVTVRATPRPSRADVGLRSFGVDEPGEFMPGRVVDGVAIERSVIVETPGNLTVECWST